MFFDNSYGDASSEFVITGCSVGGVSAVSGAGSGDSDDDVESGGIGFTLEFCKTELS